MILMRHGQSEFNLLFTATRRDPGIIDAPLTELGHAQARAAARQLASQRVSRIITSPYTRALQTAAPVATALGIPVIVNPAVRERYAFACDIGTPRAALLPAWPDHDFSLIGDEVWWPTADEPAGSVIDRAARFRAEMAALPDWSDIMVISHWGFILAMTGQSIANGQWVRCDPTGAAPEDVVWHP
jgi:broad specificity phosphatase PhoE